MNYDSGDSNSVKTALSANLTAGSAVLEKLASASDRLIAGLATGELSGKGYSAVEALFVQIIAPCILRTKSEIDSVQDDLGTFAMEDAKVSRFGVLKEDELNTQLTATKKQRDATEHQIEVNRSVLTSATTVPGLGEALETKNSQLELVLNQLENDVRDLEDRLEALHAFAEGTTGLFADGLENLAAAMAETVALLKQLAPGSAAAGHGASAARMSALGFLAGLESSKDWTSATPAELLSLLKAVSPSQLSMMLAAHPELLQRFWDHPPAPEKTAAWWKKLDATQRKEWAKAAPKLVGNLDGVPPRVRSDANFACLVADLAEAKKCLKNAKADPELTSPFEGVRRLALNRLAEAQKLADTLSRINKAYGKGPAGDPPHELYVYKPGEHIKVAISTGLLETAEHISVLVPGMGTTADDIGQYGVAAKDMRQQQWRASGVDPSKIAVLSWLDYDPPSGLDAWGVFHDDLAKAGAERLGNTLRGLTAVKDWPANADGLSVVAHSYGTDVATLALAREGVSAGHVVLLGSAGISGSIPSAAALHVPGGEVYAAQGVRDEWAGLGQFGSGRTDPTSSGFGAHPFSAENTSLDGQALKGITKHGPFGDGSNDSGSYSYLDNLTSAQYSTAMATMGRGQEVPVGGTPLDRWTVPQPQPGPFPTPFGSGR
ncbi:MULTISPECIES: alpha/beta hydrolase [unclassified Leifsonia]|uniref:alpha/beta hydrolase n=1 Tax=unclassified Leifsonia TaxID=2663824 RepID=UPI0008A78B34|nr:MULTISPECIES: alpha/beta hydrolase [unclassified Leifsonia]SEH93969.1 LXG domain of WXG superfamily protein [Leifsonia sp. CL154]SFL59519.1 LXG domain of WXG superfamily protein [Leifsonia sp. CL147]